MSVRGLYQGLPRRERLRQRLGYLEVQARGQRRAGQSLVVYALVRSRESPPPVSRLGITVNKKVGKAVVRNRVKRWVRESYRRMPDVKSRGSDLVVIAKPTAATSSYVRVRDELARLLREVHRP